MNLLARRFAWRAGRKLHMWARRDGLEDMATNGEFRLQELVVANLAPASRMVALDVGARIGDWSRSLVALANRRPAGFDIHAFEPVPESRSSILESFDVDIRADRFHVNATALSDDILKLPIYVPHSKAGTSTLHPDSHLDYERVLEIQTSTIDEYCREHALTYLDLVKVDTEGNDLKVIRGAKGLLRRGSIGVLQFEYNHTWVHSRSYLKDVYDLISDSPYRIAKVCSAALEIYVAWHPELERYFAANFALVHEGLVDKLGCRIFRIGAGNACEVVRAQ